MARLGVKNNLLIWLITLKPLNVNNSCTVRLMNKKFSADMNLTYLIDNNNNEFYSFMGIILHGVRASIKIIDSEPNINYQIRYKQRFWYEYTENDVEVYSSQSGDISLSGKPQIVFTYISNIRFISINLSLDLVNYKRVSYSRSAPNNQKITITQTRYGKPFFTKVVNVDKVPTYDDMMKLLLEY